MNLQDLITTRDGAWVAVQRELAADKAAGFDAALGRFAALSTALFQERMIEQLRAQGMSLDAVTDRLLALEKRRKP